MWLFGTKPPLPLKQYICVTKYKNVGKKMFYDGLSNVQTLYLSFKFHIDFPICIFVVRT